MTNQWKRLLSGLLALAMTFSLFVPAMATSVEDETEDDSSVVADVAEDTAEDAEAEETADDSQPTEDVSEDAEAEETVEPEEAEESAEPEEDVSDESVAEAEEEVSDEPAADIEDDTSDEPVEETEDETEEDEEEEDTASYVAEYNGVQYETLQAAFDAVVANYDEYAPTGEMEESSVITLLTDVTENINFVLVPTAAGWSNVNLTLDLNGHTLYGTGDTSSTKGAFYLSRSSSYGGTYLYFTVKDGTIANGYSSSYAGAIYGYGSYVYVTCENVSFINNTGKSAGAIYSKSVTLNNCTFTGNTATSYAGAVYSPAGCILSMSNCTITGNSGVRGGGVYIGRAASSKTTFEIDSSNLIYNNTASTAGDDIFLIATSGSNTLTVTLPDVTTWGVYASGLYQDGTYDDSTIAEDSRYSEGNVTEVSGSVELCYVASNTDLLRSIGLKVVISAPVSYTVTYTDGVDDEELFADQSYTVEYGSATPAYEGETPTRSGYTFVGWEPEVAGTVTGDVLYTAQW